jgi:hypothetical protein
MEALFKIKANDIDRNFMESIRKMFSGKEIVIKVSTEWDDTAFLSYNSANEKHILENIAAEPTVRFSGDEFRKFIDEPDK